MIALMWKESRALTATAAVMLLDFVFTLLGLAIDSRVIGGMPAWLKPAKFAISTAIFCGSMAWLFRYLPDSHKTKRWLGPALAWILVLEVAIIDFQAVRGTTSHFNIGTTESAALYSVMGVSIGVLWLLSIWISVLLFRQRFDDHAWGWALRLGMLITVLGSASGGLMTSPTSDQLAAMKRHEHVTILGAHTVGAADGGPGVAVVGWSKEHGDLRIPHFLGLHALQIIPLLVWWRRQRSVRFVFGIAGSYFALYAILLWQALRGESITQPSGETWIVLAVWMVISLGTLIPIERDGYQIEALHER